MVVCTIADEVYGTPCGVLRGLRQVDRGRREMDRRESGSLRVE